MKVNWDETLKSRDLATLWRMPDSKVDEDVVEHVTRHARVLGLRRPTLYRQKLQGSRPLVLIEDAHANDYCVMYAIGKHSIEWDYFPLH